MLQIPPRIGPKPVTTPCAPHTQVSQNPTPAACRAFKDRAFEFPFVTRQPSRISVPGAEALCLEHGHGCGCSEAFMVGTEFAHVHPPEDGSLHMMLPEDAVPRIVEFGWAEPHPMAAAGMIPSTAVMIYAPRDAGEIETVLGILRMSYDFACGRLGRVENIAF